MPRIIPIDDAIEMRNEYKTHINPLIESRRGMGYAATDFGWIDIQSLRDYLDMLTEVEKVNSRKISGVRIYFSAYPDAPSFQSSRQQVPYEGRETFFMVPTVNVESTSASQQYENLEHLPFCIHPVDASNKLEGDFVVINGLLNEHDNSSSTTDEDYSNKTSLVMNRMTLTPPPA
jgi:hypothetical protein